MQGPKEQGISPSMIGKMISYEACFDRSRSCHPLEQTTLNHAETSGKNYCICKNNCH
mgnify:CR=1 FL=1